MNLVALVCTWSQSSEWSPSTPQHRLPPPPRPPSLNLALTVKLNFTMHCNGHGLHFNILEQINELQTSLSSAIVLQQQMKRPILLLNI